MIPRILIVDDDPSTLRVLSRLISRESYSVETCESPLAAVKHLETTNYDVLLTDLILPELSGLELVRIARTLSPSIRCIVMSGHLKPRDHDECIGWVEKPFDVENLLAELRESHEIASAN